MVKLTVLSAGIFKAKEVTESSYILTNLPPPSVSHKSDMCHLRQVRYSYKKCGHGITLPDEEIICDKTDCILSPQHPRQCPNCKVNCWQRHQYPEQYTLHKDDFCPDCIRAGIAQ